MRVGIVLSVALLAVGLTGCASSGPEEAPSGTSPVPPVEAVSLESDAQAVEIAKQVMEKLGGREAWDATRFVRWTFFGGRVHYWDRHTGDIRIESPERERDGEATPARLVLMNIDSKEGRAWQAGEPVEDPALRAAILDLGHQWWVNDSYWMFMPYKLLDPGVTLKYSGERTTEDGRVGDVLDMTFTEVGYTPQNRYEVWVARDTGHVEEWTFYNEADQAEPNFSMPWENWQQFGDIWLATGRGRGMDWDIAVFDELPPSVFDDPAEVEG
jgi:hypothetical protein